MLAVTSIYLFRNKQAHLSRQRIHRLSLRSIISIAIPNQQASHTSTDITPMKNIYSSVVILHVHKQVAALILSLLSLNPKSPLYTKLICPISSAVISVLYIDESRCLSTTSSDRYSTQNSSSCAFA